MEWSDIIWNIATEYMINVKIDFFGLKSDINEEHLTLT